MANLFMDNWIVTYGIPDFPFTYNGMKVFSKFLGTMCTLLETKQVKKKAFNPQKGGEKKM